VTGDPVVVETFAALALRIRSRPAPVTPRLIAIDGPSGAGKSTFARRLAGTLGGPPVIEIDDFVSWGDLTSWWPRLEDQVLGPLVEGRSATYQRRDWKNDPHGDRLGEWRTLPASPIVILEGVTSSRLEIAGRLTCAVWIDAPRQLRLQRGIERDGDSMRDEWLSWLQREDAFFSDDRTRDRADVIVDGAPTARHAEHEFVCRRTPA
jgi:uridine kinase